MVHSVRKQFVVMKITMFLAFTLCGTAASAQQAALQTAEPQRFALVIGNAKYGDPEGNLPELGSPCSEDAAQPSDAGVVADAFLASNWEVKKVCNLTTDAMRNEINAFNTRILRIPRAFGVIYFSGHGAQVAGANYIFGVDANVDEEVEAETFRQSSYAPLFGDSAISLDDAMRRVSPLWGKAVLLIVDACRNNPIIDKLREKHINTAQYPSATSQSTNIVYAFATAQGAVAPDGGPGGISRYARFLSQAIRTSAANQEEFELTLSTVATLVMKDSHHAQIPIRDGDLQRPPRFCIAGCPSPIAEWESWNVENDEVPTSAPDRAVAAGPAPVSAPAPVAPAPPPPPPAPAFAVAAPTEALIRPTHLGLVAAAKKSLAAIGQANTVRPLHVDILYCSGDTYTDERKSKASELRDQLQVLRGPNSPVGGFEIGDVRLLPLPAMVNASIYHASDSAVMYNEGSPAQLAWARHISAASTPFLRMAAKPGLSSDSMTVLLCDSVNMDAKQPVIYIQIADDAQQTGAEALRSGMKRSLTDANIQLSAERVKGNPTQTEVRYFTKSQAAYALQVAASAAELLQYPVPSRWVPGYEAKLKRASVFELWLGHSDAGKSPDVAK